MNDLSKTRVHIVGSGPRTGTTLMAEALAACCEFDRTTNHEDRIFVGPPERGELFLTKAPQDILVVGPLLRIDPKLYVITMIRDPRDTIVSKHRLAPDKYWVSLAYWKAYIPYWRKFKNHARCITVKYADFVSDPDGVQNILKERMPFLKMTRPFSRYHETADPSYASIDALGSVRPIAPVGIGNWKKHLPRVAGQLQLHGPITDDLIEFEYERDDSWLRLLEGIKPDLSPSHLPEFFAKKMLVERKKGLAKEITKILMRRAGINPTDMRRRLGLIK